LAVVVMSTLPADADMRGLTGWWIAIDDTFPKFWERGEIRPLEEILIINADGRVEDRVMNFWSGDPQACAKTKVCSDLPLIATARVHVNGDRFAVSEYRPRSERIDAASSDGRIRQMAVTATPAWTATQSGSLLTLHAATGITRTLAKIEPDRLRRLRAGMRISGLPPAKHWRCFLAVGTVRDPAFSSLRRQPVTAPDFLEHYLRAASYIAVLDSLIKKPTADDRDLRARDLIAYETEELMAEHFDGLIIPARLADKQRLQAVAAAIQHRAYPKSAGAADDGTNALALNASKIGLSNVEIPALARATKHEPGANNMFSRELPTGAAIKGRKNRGK